MNVLLHVHIFMLLNTLICFRFGGQRLGEITYMTNIFTNVLLNAFLMHIFELLRWYFRFDGPDVGEIAYVVNMFRNVCCMYSSHTCLGYCVDVFPFWWVSVRWNNVRGEDVFEYFVAHIPRTQVWVTTLICFRFDESGARWNNICRRICLLMFCCWFVPFVCVWGSMK